MGPGVSARNERERDEDGAALTEEGIAECSRGRAREGAREDKNGLRMGRLRFLPFFPIYSQAFTYAISPTCLSSIISHSSTCRYHSISPTRRLTLSSSPTSIMASRLALYPMILVLTIALTPNDFLHLLPTITPSYPLLSRLTRSYLRNYPLYASRHLLYALYLYLPRDQTH